MLTPQIVIQWFGIYDQVSPVPATAIMVQQR